LRTNKTEIGSSQFKNFDFSLFLLDIETKAMSILVFRVKSNLGFKVVQERREGRT